MKPISFLDFRPAPGTVFEWTVGRETAASVQLAPVDPVPLSYNQELHLNASLAAERTGLPGNPWIGTSFELDGAADLDALGHAFRAWMERHEALRSGFRLNVPAERIERFTLAPDAIELVRGPGVLFESADTLHDYLDERFAAGTDPFSWPPLVLGVVIRESSSTVFVGLDHTAGDGYSLALAVWELATSYEAFLAGRAPALPETGSFLELCAAERTRGAAISADDQPVAEWREFVRASGGTAPAFPLDLGVTVGQSWPQSVYNQRILTVSEAGLFEELCEEGSGGIFAGILAAMAISIHSMTGNEVFRTITPAQTRRRPTWKHAMGWFVTCTPVEFSLGGATSFTDVLRRAQLSTQRALRLASFPALRIVELLGEDFRVNRRDFFSMVSYTDYRSMPGGDRHSEWNASTMGRVTEADDSHVWISRQHDGVHISVRHPLTPSAIGVLDDYTQRITDILLHELRGGTQPAGSDAVGWTRLHSHPALCGSRRDVETEHQMAGQPVR
ncbi:condensation domain-containing protein [Leifsonia sp. EB34]|uniref:condensation domain-containing protein n=1 Tax=Leifsonia sp. EB34 TaxID=3156303 RepID=UPI0035197846